MNGMRGTVSGSTAGKQVRTLLLAPLALLTLVVCTALCAAACSGDDSGSSSGADASINSDASPTVEAFALTVDPPEIVIHPGQQQKIMVTVTKIDPSFFGIVNVILSNLPEGVVSDGRTIEGGAAEITITAQTNAVRGVTTKVFAEGIGIEVPYDARARTSFEITTSAPAPKLDETFGVGGKMVIGAAVSREDLSSAALQSDGKIVVAGACRSGYTTVPAIARYLPTGSLDVTFGQGGVVLLDNHDSSSAVGVAIQSDGKIVVLEPTDFRLTRLLGTTGGIDTTFGSGATGSTNASFPTNTDATGTSIAIQPNDSIVVGGGVTEGAGATTRDFALARFGANGALDTTFGSGGRVTTTISANAEDMVTAIALANTGPTTTTIVAAGNVVAASGSRNAVVARYLATTGGLDGTFNATGIAITSTAAATDDVVTAVAISANKVVVAGHRHNTTLDDAIQVLRFTAGGVLDATFDGDGIALVPFNASQRSYANAILVDAGGKIVVAGDVTTGPSATPFHVALARLDDAGVLDATFGAAGTGKITSPVGDGSLARAIAMQTDGSLVIAGATIAGTNPDALVARYAGTNGSLDTTFDTDGKATAAFSFGDEELRATAVQPDGKIVVVGSAYNGSTFDMLIARALPNGTIDTTFGAGGLGYLLYDHGVGASEFAYDVRVQADGKIVVGGQGGPGTIVLRVTSSGAVDPTFGAGGAAGIAGGDGFGLVLQPLVAAATDQKIIVGGPGSATDFFLARLTPAGALDTAFGNSGAGTLTTDFGFGDRAITLATDSKGRIVLAGHSDRGVSPNFFDLAIARYEPNGALDTTFDTDGKVTFDISSVEIVYAVAVQPDDKILVGGRMQRPQQATSLGVFRVMANGALDMAFGEGGRAATNVSNPSLGDGSQASAIVVEPSHSIVVAGRSANDRVALLRLSPNGRLMWHEGTDGNQGLLTTSFGTRSEAFALARQTDGALLITGFGHVGIADQAILARYVP